MRRLLPLLLCAATLPGSAPPVLPYDLRGLVGREMPTLAYDMTGFDGRNVAHNVAATLDRTPLAAGQPAQSPSQALSAGMRLVVSIPQQKLYVFKGNDLLATSPVSTGRPGHPTPAGSFHIMEKQVSHRSNRYSNAPMPFMQRLTSSGIALHAGRLPGYAASHGCIRLPWSFAKRLYAMTDFDTVVVVTHARPRSAEDALELT